MKAARISSRASIGLIVVSAVIAWSFFLGAVLADLALESNLTIANAGSSQSIALPQFSNVVFPSKYLILAAIAALGLGALIAQKQLIARGSAHNADQQLARAGKKFADTTIVLALALGAVAAIGVFLESFFDSSGADIPASTRFFNTYLPILLYTVFIVTELLIAFVFQRGQPSAELIDRPDSPAHPLSDLASGALAQRLQRLTGLSFAVPIVAVAIALIFGLIVFDFTRSAIPVWIWVIIQAGIGVGIVLGTLLSAKSISLSRFHSHASPSASIGARNLNFVLSVIFAALLTLMSLSYAGAAAEQIRIAPGLFMSVFTTTADGQVTEQPTLKLDHAVVNVSGTDLGRGSDVRVELSLATSENSAPISTLASDRADREGMFWNESKLPVQLDVGTYQLGVFAMSADAQPLMLTLPFNVTEAGVTTWPEGTDSFTNETESLRLAPVSVSWFVSDVLPALLLLLIGSAVTVLTLTLRNPLSSSSSSDGIFIRDT